MKEKKMYLGDSVYASFGGYGIKLYLDNGYGEVNPIFLEPEVLAALIRFMRTIGYEIKDKT